MIAKLILIILPMIGLGVHMAKHGEVKEKKYNAWSHFISTLILFALYYYAGVFNSFNLWNMNFPKDDEIRNKAREVGAKFGKKAELDFGAGAEWMLEKIKKLNK